jgi:hypothetical protein
LPAPFPAPAGTATASRPLVVSLFVASVLLSVVSWYTTQQGMALYLSPWFSVLASLGIQTTLVLVAWLVGMTRTRRALLITVYSVSAVVSIAFSYVSLHTWFSARERPVAVERRLYDALAEAGGRSRELLVAAIAEAEKHALALEEMAAAERAHGYVSRAGDADPWLARVREAVAEEARTLGLAYPEGAGAGLRHTAFERHARLARQTVARLRRSEEAFVELAATRTPAEPTEDQLRAFRQVYDSAPWSEVRDTLHAGPLELPPVPAYSDFVDRTASSQEDLLIAFEGLLTAPTARHATALALATFIDLIVFLLAWASGPFFFGPPEDRWVAAGAAVDSKDLRLFVRDLVVKLRAGPQGVACLESRTLSAGERQLCLVLAAQGLAATVGEPERGLYAIDPRVHERLVEALAERSLTLSVTAPAPGSWPWSAKAPGGAQDGISGT